MKCKESVIASTKPQMNRCHVATLTTAGLNWPQGPIVLVGDMAVGVFAPVTFRCLQKKCSGLDQFFNSLFHYFCCCSFAISFIFFGDTSVWRTKSKCSIYGITIDILCERIYGIIIDIRCERIYGITVDIRCERISQITNRHVQHQWSCPRH